MKVYLAARYSRNEEMRGYRDQLAEEGIEVTSRWIEGGHEWHGEGQAPTEVAYRFATEDLEDLRAADVVVCFTEEPRTSNSRGGRHVEFGYALALGKAIIIVGPRENVFYTLRSERVAIFDAWDDGADDGAWWQLILLRRWHERFAEYLHGVQG